LKQEEKMNEEIESPVPLNFGDIRDRTTSHGYVMYMNYQFLIKSGVYAVAALALLNILTAESLPLPVRLRLFAFWLASFAFTIVTIAKWSRGAVLTNARFNMPDMILPIFAALPEYLLFIVLDPGLKIEMDWTVWYCIFGLHGFFGLMLVANRYFQTSDSDFAPDVRDRLLTKYRSWMAQDMLGTFATFCGGLLLFAWPPHFIVRKIVTRVDGEAAETVAGASIFILGIFIIAQAASQYRDIAKSPYRSEAEIS
jgi:hypothetical protein